MNTDVVEIIDCVPAVLPPRSRLYHLEPVLPVNGLGESLTSYIARLAAAHCLPLWVLVGRELAPRFKRKTVVSAKGDCDLLRNLSGAVNGLNNTARETTKVVECLTARLGLGNLTMLTAENYLSVMPLVRPIQSWCPHCLDEWSASGQTLYYPLLWNLAAIRTCPVHQTGLLDTCDRCSRSHHPLARRLRVGYCPHCSSSLGAAEGQRTSVESRVVRSSEWQVYAAKTAATLIADLASKWQAGGSGESFFAGNISHITKHVFGGSKNAFAAFIHGSWTSVSGWILQNQRPSLNAILVLAYRFGVPASKLLLVPLNADEAIPMRPTAKGDEAQLSPPLRWTPREKMEYTLREAIKKGSWPPPSLKAVCVESGFHHNQAYRRFPELARQVSEACKRYRSERRHQREQILRNAVRTAVKELHAAGVYPRYSKVKEKLARCFSLRDPLARQERVAAMTDLGLVVRPRNGWLSPTSPADPVE